MHWLDDDEIHSAGEVVPPGTYFRLDTRVETRVVLTSRDALPASFDGRVAIYRRMIEFRRLNAAA